MILPLMMKGYASSSMGVFYINYSPNIHDLCFMILCPMYTTINDRKIIIIVLNGKNSTIPLKKIYVILSISLSIAI